MAAFEVTRVWTISRNDVVEAPNAEAALERANSLSSSPSLCWQCSEQGDVEDELFHEVRDPSGAVVISTREG